MKYENNECKACKSNTPPYCGTCPYRYCESQEDADFVTKLCSDLRHKKITDRQFTIRYKKRRGYDDRYGEM